ncbi:MAG TPA: sugar phosphate isomerase/epimerase [Clostridiales bacterium]|nr:sugar phosphate isomerase/epimerase [Clostridiales bacterium]
MGKAKFAYTVWQWGTDNKEQLRQALADIREAGFEYFESVKATINVFDNDVSGFKALCEEYGVKPVGFYFHFNGDWENDVGDVKRKLPFMAACDIHRMNVQATGVVGRPATKEELDYNIKAINAIAKLAKEYDIVPTMHNHYNTTVMYESEIDYMLQNLDPDLVAFGPDTAHLVAGQCDPVKVIKKYADRVKFTHLKDITNEGMEAAGMQAGVEVYTNFRELGEGIVDFPSIFKILDDAGYDGFLTAELDRSRFGNKESAIMSMNYLKANYKQD